MYSANSRFQFDAIINRQKKTLEQLQFCVGYTIDMAVALEQISSESKECEELEGCIKDYINMEEKITHRIKVLEEIKRKQESTPGDLYNDFLAISEKIPKSKTPLQQHKKYKEFKAKVWNVNHSGSLPDQEDEDIVLDVNTQINTICPITRSEMVEPKKNPACGHTYSEQAIRDYVQSQIKKN